MAFGIGLTLALAVAAFARISGLDRERSFYATLLIVVGHYYVLFAILGGDMQALAKDGVGLIAFASVAVAGVRGNYAYIAIGLAAHGIFDAFHGHVIANAGVPEWWPAFCGSYDVAAGGLVYLGRRRRATATVFAKLAEAR